MREKNISGRIVCKVEFIAGRQIMLYRLNIIGGHVELCMLACLNLGILIDIGFVICDFACSFSVGGAYRCH